MITRVIVESCRHRLPDGVRLSAEVYRQDSSRPTPALLLRTPYSAADAAAKIDAVRLARNGWLVVVENVRGTGGSGGQLDPFAQEEADGVASVAWCRSLPYCDGRVAMTGASYEGITQWYAAHGRPAGLVAIFPRLSARAVRETWFRNGGVLRHSFLQSWALGLLYSDSRLTTSQRALVKELADSRAGLYEYSPRQSPLSALSSYYDQWVNDGDSAYWKDIDLADTSSLTSVAVLQATGWYDIFCEGALADHAAVTHPATLDGTGPGRRLIVGPWSHTSLPDQVTGGSDHGLAANGYASDLLFECHSWLAKAVNGEPCAGGARVFVVGARRWIELPAWPPSSKHVPLRLGAGEVVRLAGERDRLHLPGGRTLDPLDSSSGATVLADEVIGKRGDVVAFRTPPLPEPIEAIGLFSLEFAVRARHGVSSLIAMLAIVDERGRWTAHVEGGINLRAPLGGRRREPVASFAVHISAGQRLALVLTLSNRPAYWEDDLSETSGAYRSRSVELELKALIVPMSNLTSVRPEMQQVTRQLTTGNAR